MKKSILGLGVLAFGLIIGFLVISKEGPSNEILLKEEKQEAYTILLYPQGGMVEYRGVGGSFMQATASPTLLENNTTVKTDAKGNASILLPDNSSISLDPNTEIVVTYSSQKTSILQTLGSTYHRVEGLVKGGSYEVKTPGTLAAVRGTKFGVMYDGIKKKTKIAVTEHVVEVEEDMEVVSTTTEKKRMRVEEGKTVSLEERKNAQGLPSMMMSVTDTIKDTEMKQFVDRERVEDRKMEELKRTMEEMHSNTEEVKRMDEEKKREYMREVMRKEIKKVIFKDLTSERKEEQEKILIEQKESINEVQKPTTQTDTRVITDTTPVVEKPLVPTTAPPSTPLGEEEFFTRFEPLFFKHFYLDDADTPCTTGVQATERVKVVVAFAQASGYPFTRPTLTQFAEQIDTYCSTKDKTLKARLQSRFDEEYPFQ